MPRSSVVRAGILFAVLPWFAISCGTKKATQPGLNQSVTSVAAPEQYLNSAQQEHRELLVDGRATPIEWNLAGQPTYFLVRGIGGGGDYLVAVRSLWTYDRFGAPEAIYFLVQWPDPTISVLDHPVVNDSIDILDDQGNTRMNCSKFGPALLNPRSWHLSPLEEDQMTLEIFSDSLGHYPADNWRWGAETTDPVYPSSTIEFAGAATDGDSLGQTQHPAAGFMEDRYDVGNGPVADQGRTCFQLNYTVHPNGVVPDFIASKGTRDTRLNRGKPASYVVWSYVAKPLLSAAQNCDSLNPVRLDDTSVRDKTWNPGDYVPGWRAIFPTESQMDVLARGNWAAGKWNLEIRRKLTTPWPDDVPLVPGRHYMMRITVYDASSTRGSRSALLPLYLKPQ